MPVPREQASDSPTLFLLFNLRLRNWGEQIFMLMVQALRSNFLLLLVVTSVLTAGTAWWMSNHKPFDDAPDRPADTDLVHGNDDRNNRLHMVYEIYGMDKLGRKHTLKYGITGQKGFVNKWGNPRPEYQVPIYQLYPEYHSFMISYRSIYSNVPGRRKAKQLEQMLVNKYFTTHASMPPEQKRPLPQNL